MHSNEQLQKMHRRAQKAEGAVQRLKNRLEDSERYLSEDRSEYLRQGMATYFLREICKELARS